MIKDEHFKVYWAKKAGFYSIPDLMKIEKTSLARVRNF